MLRRRREGNGTNEVVTRAWRLAACIAGAALVVGPGSLPATADRIARGDGDDFWHRLDIRRVVNDHAAGDSWVRHTLFTHASWQPRVLRKNGWRIHFNFSIDKNHGDVERRITIQRRDGRLRATFFAGAHGTKRVPARIRVRRPDRKSIRISFAADILRQDIRRYRWWASVAPGGGDGGHCSDDPSKPCTDYAPDDGSIRHRLD